jgi:hypothetical protein
MKAVGIRGGLNRRELLLAAPALIVLPRLAFATIPPPPSSPWYLMFIADGIYKVSGFYIIDLPESYGTARTYDKIDVSQAVRSKFTFTGPHGVSPWNMLIGAPSHEYWEVLDKRNGRILRLWKYDRFEVRFSNKSRVKVVFNGPNASSRFWPLAGSERRPDGELFGDGDHEQREKGRDGGGVTAYTPSVTQFSWSWSSQDTPW